MTLFLDNFKNAFSYSFLKNMASLKTLQKILRNIKIFQFLCIIATEISIEK